MLPAIIEAVGGLGVDVFVDTGVRKSSDVIKAICLGAKGVLLGRPILWGLACGGAPALEAMLHGLQADIAADMASLGVTSIEQLGPHLLYPPDKARIDAAKAQMPSP